jgi:hypothetical protein
MSLRPLGRATAAGRYAALAAVLATFALILSAATPADSSVNGFAAFCGRLASTNTGPFPVNAIFASSGAQMVCFGRQRSQAATLKTAGSTSSTSTTAPSGTSSGGTKNVDAGDPHEDVAPSGVQAYGQSETSIAATGQYVVEAWNDATAFLTLCPDPMYKEEATGLGFSADGGQSFTDLGGLPNDCESGFVYFGDPSVEAYSAGGTAYFYISSLYLNAGTGESDLALDACTAIGTTLTCPPTPTIIATGVPFCDFLDKDFMTVDPVHQRLYISYARFQGCEFDNAGQIELAKCDISTPTTPTCDPGTDPLPYLVVSPAGGCEQEGAYPAVSAATGDVYVAWEYNWGTSLSRPECATDATHIQERVAYIPFECLTQPVASCPGPVNETGVNVTTTEAAFVPGYNRFPMNDFPRIAVSDPYNTVSVVWNDARVHVLGDIFMQSFAQATLTPVQPGPVPLNSLGKGGMHLLPALRNASASGKLTVSWYQRPDPNTTLTDVYLNSGIVPTDPNPSQTNSRVTNATSDWGAVSSDIIPNFGDYTDNYVLATPTPPYTDKTLYIAWSDGRLGLPQPFEANVSTP